MYGEDSNVIKTTMSYIMSKLEEKSYDTDVKVCQIYKINKPTLDNLMDRNR